jgi:hypothetical protein
MLLVDHDQAEALIRDVLLEDRVGANKDIDAPIGEAHQDGLACSTLFPPRKYGDLDTDCLALPLERAKVLASQDFGRR